MQRTSQTTPGRLRVQSLVIVALALATGLLASFVVSNRLNTTNSIKNDDEPVIVAAREIQANLARADAAAANAFLAGGIEDADQRLRYEDALADAGESLAEVSARVGDDPESVEAVVAMEQAVTRYAGLVETARTNNRQGFPVGAAYLNTASDLLVDEVYPNTDIVANKGAGRYLDNYNALLGTRLILVGLVALLALGLLVALLRTQTFLANTFRRRFNIALAVATALSLLLTAWLAVSFISQATNLQSARQDGYSGVRQFVDARAVGFRAKGAESRYLIARGGETTAEFDGAADQLLLDGNNSLLPQARAAADTAAERRVGDNAIEAWGSYRAVHDQIVTAVEVEDDRDTAESLALGESNVQFDRFDTEAQEALALNQTQFSRSMTSAGNALGLLTFGSLILAAAIALLALFGIQQRINEYR